MLFKLLLKEKKVLQREIAEHLGVNQTLISQWCTGLCKPSISVVREIAKYLDVSAERVCACFEKEKKKNRRFEKMRKKTMKIVYIGQDALQAMYDDKLSQRPVVFPCRCGCKVKDFEYVRPQPILKIAYSEVFFECESCGKRSDPVSITETLYRSLEGKAREWRGIHTYSIDSLIDGINGAIDDWNNRCGDNENPYYINTKNVK